MRTQSLSLVSQADGLTLSALLALPQGNPRGLVQIAHGMAEYKERYTPFLEFLTGEGYACLINDHRGHGASAASPQDLGWFGPAGARGLVEDLRAGRTADAAAKLPAVEREYHRAKTALDALP